MLIDKEKKRRKLSSEILIIVAICFTLSLVLFFIVSYLIPRIVEEYCFNNNIILDDYTFYKFDMLMFSAGGIASVVVFIVMFFALFGEKLYYIRTIISSVCDLQSGDYGKQVALIGNNELTQLAQAINFLSESELAIKEKEKNLREEKEELIRTLSHDIRTPLTSIMSYTELLRTKGFLNEEVQKEYLLLVSKKTAQIKELTDILLDGGQRNIEHFDNAILLFEQLAEEFESELEDEFLLSVQLSLNPPFSGTFDTGEIRRVFDNLISNIKKYAEPSHPVNLSVTKNNNDIVICQNNIIKKTEQSSDSYRMGINSIRRIAQLYGGTAKVSENENIFEIVITLSVF